MRPLPRIRLLLILGLVGINLLMFTLSGYWLFQSRGKYELRAQTLTQTIAGAVDLNVSKTIEKVRLAMDTMVEKVEAEIGKGLDKPAVNDFLTRYLPRIPEIEGLRVTNRDGLIILGNDINEQDRVSLEDRDYFIHHRDSASNDLYISKPLWGRISNHYIIVFSQRYNRPDGSFAGVVYATIALDHFNEVLSRYRLGPDDTIVIRDSDLGLIARYPLLVDHPAGKVGSREVSQELVRLFQSGSSPTTYQAVAPADGIGRVLTFRRLEAVPMVVVVGLASKGYLADWYTEVYKTIAMDFGFFLLSLLLGGFLLRSFSAVQKSADRLNEAQRIAHVGSWMLDPASGKLLWSDEIFRLFEVDPKRFGATYDAFLDAVHPDDRDAVNRAYTESLANRTPFDINHRLLMPDGRIKWVQERGISDFDVAGRPLRSRGTVQDITASETAAREQRRLSRALRLLGDSNAALVHAETEQTLLFDICRLVVESGGYLMAWIGVAEHDDGKSVRPVAQSGFEDGYLDGIRVSWDEAQDIGRGPIGIAIRTGQTEVNQDYNTNPQLAPWREAARRRGYKSSIGLPMQIRGSTIGVLSIYAAEADAFNAEEVALLEELALNLAFGIAALRMRDQNKAANAELAIAATAFNSQEGMVVTDANSIILRVNQAFVASSGYAAAEVVGQNPRLLKSGRHDAEFYRAMWESVSASGMWQGEIWNRRKTGEDYLAWLTISAVKNSDGAVTNYVGTQFDITERKKAQERIQNLAFFDQLTGLPNRTLLLDRLKQAMTASARNGSHCALLLADLDDFKTINDILGHEMGDFVLRQVAQRLTECVRAEDSVSRLGGDEFILMLVGLSDNETEAASQVEAVSETVLAALNRPHQINDLPRHCTPSIGITLFKGHASSAENILKQADMAMYRAKAAGRNTIRFFDPEMETVVMARAAMEADLREAIRQNQFLLHYQPQVVGSGRVTGAEALVRWQHPKRGMVSPGQFIPLAEETGLILSLGAWVLESACRQLADWARRPEMADLTIAVNVSARQFRQPDFVDTVLETIKITGANPQRLKLELTESMLVDNIQDIIEKMFSLKGRGVGFSLDDFGTGYSSLSYLKRLPLDQLKIDQSFVRDVLVDPNDASIARTIVSLAQSLGLGVIAEGVETAEQRDFLANSGCHAYQGYFFSRPLPLADFEWFVRQSA